MIELREPSADTQGAEILAFLKTGATITQLEALKRFQCFRLGARIYDLKRDGWPIDSQMVETKTGKKVKQYWLAS